MLTRLSVKSKVVLMLVTVSLLSALVVGLLGWRSSRLALSQTIFTNMTAVRRSKAAQMEAYFRNTRYAVEVLSENDMVVEAMVRFDRAFRQLENSAIPEEWNAALEAYYTSQFFPKLFANLPGQADYNLYRPQNQAGVYLQYQYMVANRFESGQKFLLDSAVDGSNYSKVHAEYHPRLRTLTQKLGFYDLFLINVATGDIVYTVAKETDYASNVDQGPFRRSNLADVLELVRNNTERGSAQLVDFDLYRPSYGMPAAFWAAPLYNGNHLVGVLVVQISLEAINQIMTANQQWRQLGLGATGETYLVGADSLMRSDARPRLEDAAAYLARLGARGVAQRTVQLINNFNTTVLLQSVDSPGVTAALQNQEGATFTTNYLGDAVLASYQPLVLEGLQWAILAEMSADEVFAPVYTYQRQLLISTVLLIAVLAFVAVGLAALLLRPLNLLIAGARTISQGAMQAVLDQGVSDQAVSDQGVVDPSLSTTAVMQVRSPDEWGELAATFTEMAQGVRQQAALLVEKEKAIGQLLHNLLPLSAVQRIRQGQPPLIDQASQVTIYAARMGGVAELAQKKGAQEVAALLQDLLTDINEVAIQYDVEQLPAPGQQLLAVCGLSTPYLDHSRRMVDFALAMRMLLQRLNTRHSAQLTLHGGVHSGALSGTVVRTQRMSYELWGESVTVAQQLATEAGPQLILTSQTIYDRLHEQYAFQPARAESKAGQRTPAAPWLLLNAKNEGGA